MATDITLPELGENVDGGTVVELHVAVGDQIKKGQTLLEIEAGKGTIEVPAPLAGTVSEILVAKGDEVKTGQMLVKVESGEAAAREKGNGTPSGSLPPKAVVSKAAPSKQSEKKPPTPAPQQKSVAAEPGPEIQENAEELVPLPEERPGRLVPASPATRLLARELGVDIAQVKGTAKNDRVTPDDVKNFVRQLAAAPASAAGPARIVARLPDFSKWGEIETEPLSTIRHETARQMALAWAQIPHVTQHDLADVTDLEAFRRALPKDGPKITVTAFALKAAAIALRQFPQFNASLDLANRQLILKKYYHIGVAVDTDRGLLVPVVRDVNNKSIQQLAMELTETAERARKRKITGEDLSGGTFTITNLGGIGGTGFTPIINYPEVAILGLSRARLQPVVHQGQMAPRLMLPLSLSYDHRVIDGADAARFTRRIAEMLENPWVMLLYA